MTSAVGGTSKWVLGTAWVHNRQLMLRSEAQHSTQQEDQPSPKIPSSTRENERQSGNRACEMPEALCKLYQCQQLRSLRQRFRSVHCAVEHATASRSIGKTFSGHAAKLAFIRTVCSSRISLLDIWQDI